MISPSMLRLQRIARCSITFRSPIHAARVRFSSQRKVDTDRLGIPLKATWSVNELLSSYPTPEISPSTLRKLYNLSALILPEEGSVEHAKVTRDMENMIRLVEAVKLVNTEGVIATGRGEGEDMDKKSYPMTNGDASEQTGRALLKHASRTVDGFYVVDTDRSR